MPATISVFFDFAGSNGAPGTQQNIDGLGPPNIRFKTNDNATIDNVDPIPQPSAGEKHSYWKHIYLKVTGGTFTEINNIKFFTDGGGFGTGIIFYVGDEMPTKNSGSSAGYEVAMGTPGDTGTELVAGHGGITAKTNSFTYTSGSPKSVTISESGNVINAVNETCNYLVFQMTIDNTAGPGDLGNEQFSLQYDEV